MSISISELKPGNIFEDAIGIRYRMNNDGEAEIIKSPKNDSLGSIVGFPNKHEQVNLIQSKERI